jgi:hypothetical protein
MRALCALLGGNKLRRYFYGLLVMQETISSLAVGGRSLRAALLDPLVEFVYKRQHWAFVRSRGPMNREVEVRFPALRRAHTGVQVRGNVFPRIQDRIGHQLFRLSSGYSPILEALEARKVGC